MSSITKLIFLHKDTFRFEMHNAAVTEFLCQSIFRNFQIFFVSDQGERAVSNGTGLFIF